MTMRKDVPVEETWDLGLIYKTKEEYLGDRKRAESITSLRQRITRAAV